MLLNFNADQKKHGYICIAGLSAPFWAVMLMVYIHKVMYIQRGCGSLDLCNHSLQGSNRSPWAATQEWHSNASISAGVTWHRAGMGLWGPWVTFDYSTRRARCAALMEKRRVSWECQHDTNAHMRGKTAPWVGMPLSFCKTHRTVQIKVLAENSWYHFQGSWKMHF